MQPRLSFWFKNQRLRGKITRLCRLSTLAPMEQSNSPKAWSTTGWASQQRRPHYELPPITPPRMTASTTGPLAMSSKGRQIHVGKECFPSLSFVFWGNANFCTRDLWIKCNLWVQMKLLFDQKRNIWTTNSCDNSV